MHWVPPVVDPLLSYASSFSQYLWPPYVHTIETQMTPEQILSVGLVLYAEGLHH